jgi:hypothetical protein
MLCEGLGAPPALLRTKKCLRRPRHSKLSSFWPTCTAALEAARPRDDARNAASASPVAHRSVS